MYDRHDIYDRNMNMYREFMYEHMNIFLNMDWKLTVYRYPINAECDEERFFHN